jgi:hypothetical protein
MNQSGDRSARKYTYESNRSTRECTYESTYMSGYESIYQASTYIYRGAGAIEMGAT